MTEERRIALEQNLSSLILVHIGSGMMLSVAIIVPFLQENGLTLEKILLLQSIFSAAIVLLEIPSGYFSDRLGRVVTTQIGAITGFLAFLVYALSSSFPGFVCAELFLALGFSCYSGTLEALTYDTLLELDRTAEFRKINGRQFLAHFGSEAVGAIFGGMLALLSLRTPFWANLVPFGLACIAAMTLTEPERHKIQEKSHFKAIWDICTHTLVRNPATRGIVLLHACIASMTLMLFWSTQPFQEAAGLPLALFGITHAVMVAAGALASGTVHTLEGWMDDRLLLVGIAAVVVISFLALGWITAIWGLVFFLVARTAWGLLTPTTNDLVNRMTSSDIRATTLSVKGMAMRIVFAIGAPLLGRTADLYTLPRALLLGGIVGGVVIGAIFLSMRPYWEKIPK